MFSNFGRTLRIKQSLVNQTIGGQSVIFRLFREVIEADTSSIRKLELTYFAAATVHYAFIAWGRSGNKDRIAREFIEIAMATSLPHAGEPNLSVHQALSEYEVRRGEYFRLIDMVIGRQPSSSGSPAVTLAMHLFEAVTNSSAQGLMVRIAASAPAMAQFIADNADFVKTQL